METKPVKIVYKDAEGISTFCINKVRILNDTLSRRELEPNCVPQLFLGWLLGKRRSAIGHLFPLFRATIPEVFAKVYSDPVFLQFLKCRMAACHLAANGLFSVVNLIFCTFISAFIGRNT